MIIRNFKALATTRERRDALAILNAGIKAVLVRPALRTQIHRTGNVLAIQNHHWNLSHYERIFVIGAGKASLDAARVLNELLGTRVTQGIMIDTRAARFSRITVLKGTHPLLSSVNVVATKKILELVERATEEDLILAVFSGGGSALFEMPRISLAHYTRLTRLLLERGATIKEINTIRKHLSFVKGGQLAQRSKAPIVTLLVSDVLSNDPSIIASGPTTPDKTFVRDALRIQKKYNLSSLPFVETPKKKLPSVSTSFLITNVSAVDSMVRKAKDLGYKPKILGTHVQGEARVIGKRLAQSIHPGMAIIGSGETTVTVKGNGKGGRNQELVLGALTALKQGVVASCASDGVDFITEAAGGLVDVHTQETALKNGLDVRSFLEDNDSYHFLKKTNGLIVTGKTGTNVGDVMVALCA